MKIRENTHGLNFSQERISIIIIVSVLIFFILGITAIFAAKNEFRVLASKGETFIQKSGKGKWERIYTGGIISSNDKIKLTQGAYIGLVYTNGRTVELKKVGTYSAAKLSKEILALKSTVTEKLANLIVSQMGESVNILEKDNDKNNMTQTGAVERSLDSGILTARQSEEGVNIRLILTSPIKASLLNPVATFSWHKLPGDISYEFLLCDRFDRPEYSKNIKDTSITLNTYDLKLEDGVYYFWKVTANTTPGIKSDEACFMVLHENERANLNDTLKMLNEELGYEVTAASRLVLAIFYERYDLINEADVSYREAIQLAPGVDDYKKVYSNFLKRHYE
jgi:hypothetical protein